MKNFIVKIASSLVIIMMLFMITSFNVKKSLAFVTCEWFANASPISIVTMSNCVGSKSEGFIAQGTSFWQYLIHNCQFLTLDTLIGSSHPGGTLTIYRNGVLIYQITLVPNQNIADETFPAITGDHFKVYWN